MPECLCLYPYVWTFLAWQSIRAECTRVVGVGMGGGGGGRPTQWTLEGRFILNHYLVLKDHSNREGAGCVHTQNTLLSSSQSLIYPLNPHLSIASEHILSSHVINLFSAWSVGLWGRRQKVICYSAIRISDPFWPGIKVPKFYTWSQITFWCI